MRGGAMECGWLRLVARCRTTNASYHPPGRWPLDQLPGTAWPPFGRIALQGVGLVERRRQNQDIERKHRDGSAGLLIMGL